MTTKKPLISIIAVVVIAGTVDYLADILMMLF